MRFPGITSPGNALFPLSPVVRLLADYFLRSARRPLKRYLKSRFALDLNFSLTIWRDLAEKGLITCSKIAGSTPGSTTTPSWIFEKSRCLRTGLDRAVGYRETARLVGEIGIECVAIFSAWPSRVLLGCVTGAGLPAWRSNYPSLLPRRPGREPAGLGNCHRSGDGSDPGRLESAGGRRERLPSWIGGENRRGHTRALRGPVRARRPNNVPGSAAAPRFLLPLRASAITRRFHTCVGAGELLQLLLYGGQSAAELGLTPPLVFCVRIWQRGNTRWEADRIRAPAPRARRPLESAGGSGRERCNGDPGAIAGSLLPHRQSRNGLGVVDGRGAASVLEATPPHHSSVRDLWHVGSRLVDCVQSGTCQAAGVPGVKVAGKTGTATALDGSGATHAWFVGFAPAEQPEIALVVFLERGTGAQNAAPLAGKLLRRSQRDCGS